MSKDLVLHNWASVTHYNPAETVSNENDVITTFFLSWIITTTGKKYMFIRVKRFWPFLEKVKVQNWIYTFTKAFFDFSITWYSYDAHLCYMLYSSVSLLLQYVYDKPNNYSGTPPPTTFQWCSHLTIVERPWREPGKKYGPLVPHINSPTGGKLNPIFYTLCGPILSLFIFKY